MSILKVFDNLIEKPLQEEIKSTLLGREDNFNWFYLNDVTTQDPSVTQSRPAFDHVFYFDHAENSDFNWIPIEIVDRVVKELKLETDEIADSKTFLQLPLSSDYLKDNTVDTAHVDSSNPHLVFLYYVIDSDGDTIIYDKKYEEGETHLNHEMTSKLLIKKRVTPKQGRLVVFDGRYWHTAEQPKYNKRCVINTNVIYQKVGYSINKEIDANI